MKKDKKEAVETIIEDHLFSQPFMVELFGEEPEYDLDSDTRPDTDDARNPILKEHILVIIGKVDRDSINKIDSDYDAFEKAFKNWAKQYDLDSYLDSIYTDESTMDVTISIDVPAPDDVWSPEKYEEEAKNGKKIPAEIKAGDFVRVSDSKDPLNKYEGKVESFWGEGKGKHAVVFLTSYPPGKEAEDEKFSIGDTEMIKINHLVKIDKIGGEIMYANGGGVGEKLTSKNVEKTFNKNPKEYDQFAIVYSESNDDEMSQEYVYKGTDNRVPNDTPIGYEREDGEGELILLDDIEFSDEPSKMKNGGGVGKASNLYPFQAIFFDNELKLKGKFEDNNWVGGKELNKYYFEKEPQKEDIKNLSKNLKSKYVVINRYDNISEGFTKPYAYFKDGEYVTAYSNGGGVGEDDYYTRSELENMLGENYEWNSDIEWENIIYETGFEYDDEKKLWYHPGGYAADGSSIARGDDYYGATRHVDGYSIRIAHDKKLDSTNIKIIDPTGYPWNIERIPGKVVSNLFSMLDNLMHEMIGIAADGKEIGSFSREELIKRISDEMNLPLPTDDLISAGMIGYGYANDNAQIRFNKAIHNADKILKSANGTAIGGKYGESDDWNEFAKEALTYLKDKYPRYTDELLEEDNGQPLDDDEYNDAFFELVDAVREEFLVDETDTWANTIVEDYMSNPETVKEYLEYKDDKAADGTSISQRNKVSEVMHEFKEGKLHDSHGNIVTNPKQAIAIALSVSSKYNDGGKLIEEIDGITVIRKKRRYSDSPYGSMIKEVYIKGEIRPKFFISYANDTQQMIDKLKDWAKVQKVKFNDIETVKYVRGGRVGVSRASNGIKNKAIWIKESNGVTTGVFSQKSFEEIFKEIEDDKNFKLVIDDDSMKVFERISDGYRTTFRLKTIWADGGGISTNTYDVMDGTKIIADFDNKKDAENFIYERHLKYPKIKLSIKHSTFNEYKNKLEDALFKKYAIMINDTGFDDTHVKLAMDNKETIESIVDHIGDKYDLTPVAASGSAVKTKDKSSSDGTKSYLCVVKDKTGKEIGSYPMSHGDEEYAKSFLSAIGVKLRASDTKEIVEAEYN